MESWFFEPLRETKIGLKNQRVWEIRGKITVFDWGEGMAFGSSYQEIGKIEGSKNQDSTVIQLLLVTLLETFSNYCWGMVVQMLCSDTSLYLCFNRRWIFSTVWTGTQKGMHVLHVCLLSWTIFWNYRWTLKERVRKFQLLNYVIRVSLISNDYVNIMKEKFASHLCLLIYFCSLGKGTPKKKKWTGVLVINFEKNP